MNKVLLKGATISNFVAKGLVAAPGSLAEKASMPQANSMGCSNGCSQMSCGCSKSHCCR